MNTPEHLSSFARVVSDHLARYPAAPPVPSTATWWARTRHADRQARARANAYRTLSDDVHSGGAYANAERSVSSLEFAKRRAEWCIASQPGYTRAQEVVKAAMAAVVFVDEPEPAEAPGGRLGLGKGTASAPVPQGAIARRGGSESSVMTFYDRTGAIVAAYYTRSWGSDAWAETCSREYAENHFAAYYHPIQACVPTPIETTIAVVFGGKS